MNEVPPTNSGASNWKYFSFAVVLIIAGATAVVFLFSTIVGFNFWHRTPPIYLVQADEGFKKAKTTINPEKLRAWAIGEMAKQKPPTNGYLGKDIPNSEIPDYIQNLYADAPENAAIHYNGDQSFVYIMWGGGFFHYGFEVGETNFLLPFNSDNSEYPYDFEWKSGIYYTREASWKLQ